MSEPCGGKREISFIINGTQKVVRTYPAERLLDVLRCQLGLTGTKEGCGEGECGACSVLIDGVLANSCLIPVAQVHGAELTTIEGIAANPRYRALQQAFLECGAAQCGICTPGMILASVELFHKKPKPTLDDIREGLSGNICRCTGYLQIFDAVAEAARRSEPA
jgi:aerobic carbon-monoxide dehydrogenase small subunit